MSKEAKLRKFREDNLKAVKLQGEAFKKALGKGLKTEDLLVEAARLYPKSKRNGEIFLDIATVSDKTEAIYSLLYGWSREDIESILSQSAKYYGLAVINPSKDKMCECKKNGDST